MWHVDDFLVYNFQQYKWEIEDARAEETLGSKYNFVLQLRKVRFDVTFFSIWHSFPFLIVFVLVYAIPTQQQQQHHLLQESTTITP